ncbi:MAG TPA: beta-hydroxyacyl-ACP dehydratase [Phycisphaerae bacterium]|nr:beta-hydroxyacyl-ACP dehydratase [Phycisphaerae bacterium]HRW53374.1 beta-hydroxyacyl-ACP dehydratase [Phycisphaerae bacterium]
MKFILIDRIVSMDPGQGRIVARKQLSLAEEYLADHFPTFPVMPGVMMLEAMVQTSSWLVRATQGFSKSMIVLAEAKNVNYKSFVAPGGVLEVTSEAVQIDDTESDFKAVGRGADGGEIVKARLKLRHYNLTDLDASLAETDEKLVSVMKQRFELLGGPAAVQLAAVTAAGE